MKNCPKTLKLEHAVFTQFSAYLSQNNRLDPTTQTETALLALSCLPLPSLLQQPTPADPFSITSVGFVHSSPKRRCRLATPSLRGEPSYHSTKSWLFSVLHNVGMASPLISRWQKIHTSSVLASSIQTALYFLLQFLNVTLEAVHQEADGFWWWTILAIFQLHPHCLMRLLGLQCTTKHLV